MNHPFELELSQLKSVNLKIEDLDVEEITDEKTEKIAGGGNFFTLALGEQGGNPSKPVITYALYEQGGNPSKPILTKRLGEGGGDNTSALLGESAEGPRF